MTKLNQIYKCEVCGNIVEVVHEAGGVLVCCGQPMKLLEENTFDASKEKHVPVIEGKKVTIGSIPHPMEEAHYIEFIEAISKTGERCRKFLKPGDKPEAEFCFEVIEARELCNLHGLWKSS
ncbi:MAG: desulfoferrodoxin [Nanoarchaeota archaeon]|nr:desulfoferrodoxin [Nanoarchaeota archaeon]